MAMTREQVLAQMEADYAQMDEDFRNEVLFSDGGVDYTPTALITEVRNDTDFGKRYVQSWSANQEQKAQLMDLLASLLGGDESAMTCGDPDCPNCKGEVRPLFDRTGTDPEKLH